jgi:hypothetical protein
MIRSSSRAAERMDVNSVDGAKSSLGLRPLLRECNNFNGIPNVGASA